MIENLKISNKAVGYKQTIKAIQEKRTNTVFIAKDADIRLTSKVIELCNQNGIAIHYVDTMKQLGRACKIDVGAAVASIIL